MQEWQSPLLEGVQRRRVAFRPVHEAERKIGLAGQLVVAVADLTATMLTERPLDAARAERLRRAEPFDGRLAKPDESHERRAGLLAAVAAMAIGTQERGGMHVDCNQPAPARACVERAAH